MSPARRKRFLRLKNSGKKRRSFRLLFYLALLIALLGFFFLNTRLWKFSEKVGLVINRADGDIAVMSLDRKNKDITTIEIPGATELDVSRQLGRWRAKSIWQLGENEKVGGSLLRETIVKNFHFPILGWADSGASGFADGDLWGIIKAIFVPYKSNLTLADKIRIGLFSLGVTPSERSQILLGEGRFLKKVTLKDGEEGYVVQGKIPKELLVVFSQPQIAQQGLKVNLKDASGQSAVATEVGATIEVLGAKIAAVSRLPIASKDCLVSGRPEDFRRILAAVFDCEIVKTTPSGNFDIEIEIGERFAKRF
jgi:hypothetical protein